MKSKGLLSYLNPYRKYTLTTERSAESVMRTMRRITGERVYPATSEFYGRVDINRFQIRYNVRYRMNLDYKTGFPPIMDGTIQEAGDKTVIHISTRLPTSYCVVFGFFYFALFVGFFLGLFFICNGNLKDGLTLLLICAGCLLGHSLLMGYSAVITSDRAIKRLAHLLFAEPIDSNSSDDENE